MAVLTETVLVDGEVHAVGTERTQELGDKIPSHFWSEPTREEPTEEKPTRSRAKATKSE